ncbi:MAG: hypothetical protein KF868_04435 [Acidobacteria bacterium]|nr:hypothetical protein [Acidobacteriota bacterium]
MIRIITAFALLALSVPALTVPASAQHQHPAGDAKPATLMPGFSNHHHPVKTSSAEAQRFFDQGLAILYAFNHEESARSFRRAAALDPEMAMAYWGIALAVGPNYNEPTIDLDRMKAAYEAIQKGRTLAASGPAHERDYIEALARRFTLDPNPDGKLLGRAYADAMRALASRYPDDLDAATLFADSLMNLNPWQLWTRDGRPAPGTEEIVAILEGVLKRDPDHIGANHLYIHAVEASTQPERALPSAARLGRLAPSAGHLVHMPGHIYLRTGDYSESAKSNELAAEADRRYIEQTGARGMYAAMYYSHNLHFLVESYGRMGNYAKALASARRLEENVRGYVAEMPMIEGFLPSPYFTMLRFGRWSEMLEAPEPDRAHKLTHALWRYARCAAFAGAGKISEAQSEQARFLEEASNLPGETPFGLNSAESVLRIARHVVAARIAWARGDKSASIAEWKMAAEAQDALNYDEPPGWYYPVRESLGAALLLSGRAAEAEDAFRADLKVNARNGRSLFGLMESLKAQKKDAAARRVEMEFERAWKEADVKLRIEDL